MYEVSHYFPEVIKADHLSIIVKIRQREFESLVQCPNLVITPLPRTSIAAPLSPNSSNKSNSSMDSKLHYFFYCSSAHFTHPNFAIARSTVSVPHKPLFSPPPELPGKLDQRLFFLALRES